MRRVGLRALMAAVGLVVLAAHLGVAYLGYRVLVALWVARPDWPTALAAVVVAGVALGYASYRFGTVRLLASLEATELPRDRAPGLHGRLDDLVAQMDVARPRLFLADLGAPNALSVGGGDHGAVVLDRSLFRLLDAAEVEALLAHELAHLESHDSLVQTLAYSLGNLLVSAVLLALTPAVWLLGGLARALGWLAGRPTAWPENAFGRLQRRVGQAVLLALVAVSLLVLAHSRRREYAADDRAAAVTDPLVLARALTTIARAADPELDFLSPLSVHGDDDPSARWLSSHPPFEERIGRLVDRAAGEDRVEI
jgi:heat shock protein HtpX